jgi:hypothetical protein
MAIEAERLPSPGRTLCILETLDFVGYFKEQEAYGIPMR